MSSNARRGWRRIFVGGRRRPSVMPRSRKMFLRSPSIARPAGYLFTFSAPSLAAHRRVTSCSETLATTMCECQWPSTHVRSSPSLSQRPWSRCVTILTCRPGQASLVHARASPCATAPCRHRPGPAPRGRGTARRSMRRSPPCVIGATLYLVQPLARLMSRPQRASPDVICV